MNHVQSHWKILTTEFCIWTHCNKSLCIRAPKYLYHLCTQTHTYTHTLTYTHQFIISSPLDLQGPAEPHTDRHTYKHTHTDRTGIEPKTILLWSNINNHKWNYSLNLGLIYHDSVTEWCGGTVTGAVTSQPKGHGFGSQPGWPRVLWVGFCLSQTCTLLKKQ